MNAYLARDYAASVACLSQWLDAAPARTPASPVWPASRRRDRGARGGEDGARIAADAGRLQDGIARLRGAGS